MYGIMLMTEKYEYETEASATVYRYAIVKSDYEIEHQKELLDEVRDNLTFDTDEYMGTVLVYIDCNLEYTGNPHDVIEINHYDEDNNYLGPIRITRFVKA